MFPKLSRFRSILSVTAALGLASTAGACKSQGDTETPDAQAQQQIDLEAKAAERKKTARAQSLVDLANEDLRVGRYVSATQRAEEALEENPDDADAHAILGAARWRAGDFEGSTEAFRKAIELEPTNFGAVLGLGRNLQAVGNHEEAIELQDQLLAEEKEQVDPMLTKLRSLYALVRADEAVDVLDDIFKYLPAEDPQLPVVQAYAAFLRPLKGKGPFVELAGSSGSSDLQLDLDMGLKHSLAIIGGQPSRAVFLEIREEAIVDPSVVERLGLEEIGKVKPPGQEEESGLVVVPEVKFGDMTIENIPALVQPLENLAAGVGETPGIVLGRQVMHKIGSITFDFPARSLSLAAEAPASAPEGATDARFLLLDLSVVHAPALPITIDESEHDFYVYFGGIYKAAASITRKDYLKSDHLPRELTPPDDAQQGLKMVYLEQLTVGDLEFPGLGALVFVNEPPDANLSQVLEATAFELGGYLNFTLLQTLKVTYAISSGKVYLTDMGA